MVAVADDGPPGLRIHLQQGNSISQAGVAVSHALRVQDEGRIPRYRRGNRTHQAVPNLRIQRIRFRIGQRRTVFPAAVPAGEIHEEAVPVPGKAVGQAGNGTQRRRKAPQGLDQARIAVHLQVETGDDLVEGQLMAVEFLKLGSHFAEGISHVERAVLILRIQHQGQFVTLFDHVDHPVVLGAATVSDPAAAGELAGILLSEFIAEHGKGLSQVAFIEHGKDRQSQQEGDKRDEPFLIHHRMLLEQG